MFKYFPQTAGWLAGVSGFLIACKDTFLESFFRWIFLGFILDFVYASYQWIMIVCGIIFFTRWVKDWRWLFGIGGVIAYFVFFVLNV